MAVKEANRLAEKPIDVTALGELLIDMTPHGMSNQGNQLYEANPGGAPCNVLAMVKRLGGHTAFIGKVGADAFGFLLEKTLQELLIDTQGLVKDPGFSTTLAFVHLDEKGDRSFSFYRNPGADRMLEVSDVREDLIRKAGIFHFGTLSMTHEPSKSATKYAIDLAKKHNCLISFDPNIRPPLWDSLKTAKAQMAYGLSVCDILKISDDELKMATGFDEPDKAIEQLRADFPNIRLLFVTLGSRGSCYSYGLLKGSLKAFINIETVDTTGAGDTFTGCCLYWINQFGINHLNEERLHFILRFANAAASLVTTKKGALKVMPERTAIEELINRLP